MNKKDKTEHTYHIAKNIAKTLILFRVWKGFTQSQIAGSIGVTFQQVQKYEKLINRISAESLIDLCQKRKWDISVFASGSPETTLGIWKQEVNLEDPESIYQLRLEQILKAWAKLDRVGKTNYYHVRNTMVNKLIKISNDLEDAGINPKDTILPIVKGDR